MGFQFNEWEDVSVIIPAYNAEETILRALHSVANQTAKPCEIIVIDDGSTDSTIKLVEKEAAMEGWVTPIKLLKQKKKGPGTARNFGIKNAKGRYIAFLDADDEWHINKLVRSMEELRKHNATIVAHDVIHQYPMGRKFYIEHSKRHFSKPLTKLSLFLFDYVNNSTVVAEKDAIIKAGGFDENNMFDLGYDLWLTILEHPQHSLHIFKGALVTYYIQNKSLSSQYLKRLACQETFIIRHAYKSSPFFMFAAPFLGATRCLFLQNKICNRAAHNKDYHHIFLTLLRLPYAVVKTFTLSLYPLPYFQKNRK
jgi:glycosyltransferase involved in cell wall biosynthesis